VAVRGGVLRKKRIQLEEVSEAACQTPRQIQPARRRRGSCRSVDRPGQ
jgi:hypothetical protein